MWSGTIQQLLEKLADTTPGEGMIGEVYYWRDMIRILDGIAQELKQPQVELTVQVLIELLSRDKSESLSRDVEHFQRQKSRVMKGAKEARWNNKYMKIIEHPVKKIEEASDLLDI